MALDQAETPVWRQYLQIRQRHPDTILLFRIGDVYEAFDKDAPEVARILGIAQGKRKVIGGNPVSVATIPASAAQVSIQRLIAAGRRVAVCEKVGES